MMHNGHNSGSNVLALQTQEQEFQLQDSHLKAGHGAPSHHSAQEAEVGVFSGLDAPSAYLECFRLVKDPASFLPKPPKENDKQYLRKVSLRELVVQPPHVYRESHEIDIYCLLVLMKKSTHPVPPALCFPQLQRRWMCDTGLTEHDIDFDREIG